MSEPQSGFPRRDAVTALGGSLSAGWILARDLLDAGEEFEDTVPGLIRALDDTDGLVRAQTAQTLGSMSHLADAARPALQRGLGDALLPVRRECQRALQALDR